MPTSPLVNELYTSSNFVHTPMLQATYPTYALKAPPYNAIQVAQENSARQSPPRNLPQMEMPVNTPQLLHYFQQPFHDTYQRTTRQLARQNIVLRNNNASTRQGHQVLSVSLVMWFRKK